jgi:hypothetical protein
MADVYNTVGSGLGLAELRVAKAIGQIVGFQHRNKLPVPVYINFNNTSTESLEVQNGRKTSHQRVEINMAVQSPISGVSGFSGTYAIPKYADNKMGVLEGDRFEYPVGTGNYYYVRGIVEARANGYIWKVPIEGETSTSLGNRS